MAVARRQVTTWCGPTFPLHMLLGLSTLLSACTDPQFSEAVGDAGTGPLCGATACDRSLGATPSDSGSADSAGPRVADATVRPVDGSAEPEASDAASVLPVNADAGLPPRERARDLLIGKYAVRARFYARDLTIGAATLSQEITWLADIVPDEQGDLALFAQICEDHAQNIGPLPKIVATLQYPEKTPVRRFEVMFTEDGFRTTGNPYLIGYTDEVPANCKEGQTVNGPNGPCVCPTSRTNPPIRANDCRVFDSDMDGHPGYSVQLTGGFNRIDYVRHKDMSQMVMGKISAEKKHTAIYQYNHDHYTLDCTGACPVSEYEPCLLEESQVLFEPIASKLPSGAEWTCTEVMQKSVTGEFFMLTSLARSCN